MALLETDGTTSLHDRLHRLWEATGDRTLRRLSQGLPAAGLPPCSSGLGSREAISSCLMRCFRETRERRVFDLLMELNRSRLLSVIRNALHRRPTSVDAEDVLQEVTMKIYRYPTRFACDRADAFRNWSYGIVRNTIHSLLHLEARAAQGGDLSTELAETRPDPSVRSPLRCAADAESREIVDTAYLIYLNLYLLQYDKLRQAERQALHDVEVSGLDYKSAAARIGIPVNNFKMLLFRARRKIHRGVQRTLERM